MSTNFSNYQFNQCYKVKLLQISQTKGKFHISMKQISTQISLAQNLLNFPLYCSLIFTVLLPTVSPFRSALSFAIINSFSRLVVRQVSPQVADGVAYKILSRGRLTVPRVQHATPWLEWVLSALNTKWPRGREGAGKLRESCGLSKASCTKWDKPENCKQFLLFIRVFKVLTVKGLQIDKTELI